MQRDSKHKCHKIHMSEWTPEKALTPELREYLRRHLDSSNNKKPAKLLLVFLHVLSELKATKRTGWIDFDIHNPESIADHMYRMSIITMLSTNSSLDKSKCTQIAVVHDMAEALVGDITPMDGIPKDEKHRREYAAIGYMTDLVRPYNSKAADDILALWLEYENVSTPEARFVKDVDKFELLVQTLEYERAHNGTKDLSEFVSVYKSIKTPEVLEWADTVLEERRDFWDQIKSNSKPSN